MPTRRAQTRLDQTRRAVLIATAVLATIGLGLNKPPLHIIVPAVLALAAVWVLLGLTPLIYVPIREAMASAEGQRSSAILPGDAIGMDPPLSTWEKGLVVSLTALVLASIAADAWWGLAAGGPLLTWAGWSCWHHELRSVNGSTRAPHAQNLRRPPTPTNVAETAPLLWNAYPDGAA